MFVLPVILVCLIETFAAHFIQGDYTYDLNQVQAMLLAIAAVSSQPTQRDKSVLSVLVGWFAFIAMTDRAVQFVPPDYLFIASYEVVVLSILIMWALVRPHFYTSADLSQRGENVYIGFYQGTHAPFLSSVGALFGLPFSSIVIVAGDKVLRPSASGKMVINNTSLLRKGDFILVDTGKVATEEIINAIIKCDGLPTKAFGIFKTKCVQNCEPVLELLGLKPKSWPYYLPSIFYYQAVRGSRASE